MSQKNVLIVIIIILVLVGGLLAWYFLQDDTDIVATNTNAVTNQNVAVDTFDPKVDKPAENTVWIIDGSFNPSVVTISVGDSITWVNKDDLIRQVASDPHPSHSALPSLESEELAQDDDYTYTFDKVGEWFYHDHMNPISKGTIIVE